MSHEMYWSRPPVEPERDGPEGMSTQSLVVRALTGPDGDDGLRLVGRYLLVKGDPRYHYLRGVHDVAADDELVADLGRLLAIVDIHGEAVVWTEPG